MAAAPGREQVQAISIVGLNLGENSSCDFAKPNPVLDLVLDATGRDRPPAVGADLIMCRAEHLDRALRRREHQSVCGGEDGRPSVKPRPQATDLGGAEDAGPLVLG